MISMPKDIGDVLPTPEALEGEKVQKEDYKDKVMTVLDYVLLPSTYAGQDSFSVVQADCAGKKITFSGGQVITKKLSNIGREAIKEANGLKCKLIKTKGKSGRQYFDLGSAK